MNEKSDSISLALATIAILGQPPRKESGVSVAILLTLIVASAVVQRFTFSPLVVDETDKGQPAAWDGQGSGNDGVT